MSFATELIVLAYLHRQIVIAIVRKIVKTRERVNPEAIIVLCILRVASSSDTVFESLVFSVIYSLVRTDIFATLILFSSYSV